MKIAYYVSNRNTFPPQQNQIAASITVVTNIIENLKKKHQITLYAAKGSKIPGIEIVDLNLKPFIIDSAHASNDWITKTTIGLKQIPIGKLFEDSYKYDIIHVHTEPIYLAMPYVNLIKTPVLFTSHNEYHDFEEDIFEFYNGKVHFSALSKRQAKRFPMSQNIPVIYNGIELDDFKFNFKSEDYFLFLGRMVEDKGIDVFLELAKANSSYEFYIVGRGDSKYEELAKKYSKKYSNIKYLGMIPRKTSKWYKVISHAKALIMPIKYEDTCPLVPLESMACGTPVIAFDKGALPEMIADGVNGYIVNSNPKSLKEALAKINLLNIHQYQKMRQNARLAIETNFTVEKMAASYESLYQKIINSKKGSL